MRGVYERRVVQAAAVLAVEHWKAEFETRKVAWINSVAGRQVGWLRKRPVGQALAEKCFEGSAFSDLPVHAYGGSSWRERAAIEVAERLVHLTDRAEPGIIILDDDEMWALHPVFPEAAAAP